MKKLVALAVAGAFVAPVYAADVSVSGDVEYIYLSKGAGAYFDSGDQDVTVKATETMDNGLTISVSLEMDGNEDGLDSDSVLTISGGFGSVMLGDEGGTAAELYDEKSDVAEQGGTGGAGSDTTTHSLVIQPNLGVEGLAVAISSGTTAASVSAVQVNSFALQYSTSGATVAYSSTNTEGTTVSEDVMSLSYAMGAFYVGYDSVSSVANVQGTDKTNFGITYNYGPGKLFIESGKTGASGAKTETTAIGASYKIGSVNLYALMNDIEVPATPASNDEVTIVGIEYSF